MKRYFKFISWLSTSFRAFLVDIFGVTVVYIPDNLLKISTTEIQIHFVENQSLTISKGFSKLVIYNPQEIIWMIYLDSFFFHHTSFHMAVQCMKLHIWVEASPILKINSEGRKIPKLDLWTGKNGIVVETMQRIIHTVCLICMTSTRE